MGWEGYRITVLFHILALPEMKSKISTNKSQWPIYIRKMGNMHTDIYNFKSDSLFNTFKIYLIYQIQNINAKYKMNAIYGTFIWNIYSDIKSSYFKLTWWIQPQLAVFLLVPPHHTPPSHPESTPASFFLLQIYINGVMGCVWKLAFSGLYRFF